MTRFALLTVLGFTLCAAPAAASTDGAALEHKRVADRLVAEDKFDAAVAEYGRALALDPGYADARFNLAVAHFQGGRIDAAAEALEGVLALAPDDAEAAYDLGCLRLRQNRLAEAEACFEACLASQKKTAFKSRSARALAWIRDLKAADPGDRAAVLALLQRLSALMPGF